MSPNDYGSVDEYIKNINAIPALIPEEELLLANAAAQGDEAARQKFAEAHLRLVIPIAKVYVDGEHGLHELIQAGNIGLFCAVEKFDPAQGFKFSAYATQWIREAITSHRSDQK